MPKMYHALYYPCHLLVAFFLILVFASSATPVFGGTQPLAYAQRILSPEGYGAKGALIDSHITIADMLQYAIEDEYLAQAKCAFIIEKFGEQKIYSDLLALQGFYIEKLKELYAQLALTPPSDRAMEHFEKPSTLKEAAEQGVKDEMENMAMYVYFLTFPLPEPIEDVFTRLREGSEDQMAVFVGQSKIIH
ncbi:hypothetical protein SpiGrapes_1214 [Sphaerochaeta pleomorpha str. Grapes]|uniref:DUF2202 domain-containing protein n=1 Tax=Sphaerochaeta pleomorpha (strain ATCC BAA-1885 / DSM 22778 / Grapes) TaxID=158190 RepID=G8QT64_SPHPG|nr:hypothetical protein [Sphaerochaeta pleomorpha]AEV29031.1 hypothetical protein SpiGrapes_1214 [Sphaerochaeta pleomorpha str. Grapes]